MESTDQSLLRISAKRTFSCCPLAVQTELRKLYDPEEGNWKLWQEWVERMDDEEGEEDEDELFHTGEECIDRVAEAVIC